MKSSWSQPSLYRDFALLAAAAIFLLFLISTLVTYTTYRTYADYLVNDLNKESQRIDRMLATQMEEVNYLLTVLGKQIVLNSSRDVTGLAQTLKSFDGKNQVYVIFSWVNPQQQITVSSNKGILDKPTDVSDRDYVRQAAADPWKIQIGRPIEGRVSEEWVIPAAMGLTDATGKFIGSVVISIDIKMLAMRLSDLTRREGINFALVERNLLPLTQLSEDRDFVTKTFPIQKLSNINFTGNPYGLILQDNLFGLGNYFYYRALQSYPYVILLGYDTHYDNTMLQGMLWSRLMQVLVIALFFLGFLWIMRLRMIRPLLEMTAAAGAVARGEYYQPLKLRGPQEMQALATQISRISQYLEEIKRIEDELRNKMFMLKHAKERAETSARGKSEFLAYICQEMRSVLNQVSGFAQTMRDQLHGPIENRKYRQYASEIYTISNTLLGYTQDLLTLSKSNAGYLTLEEKPLDAAETVAKTLRLIADKMQVEKCNVHVKNQEPLPKLMADEFRLQQLLSNILLYAFYNVVDDKNLQLELRAPNETKAPPYFAILIRSQSLSPVSNQELGRWVQQLAALPDHMELPESHADLHLELAKSIVELHEGYLGIQHIDGALSVAIIFTSERIRAEEQKR